MMKQRKKNRKKLKKATFFKLPKKIIIFSKISYNLNFFSKLYLNNKKNGYQFFNIIYN